MLRVLSKFYVQHLKGKNFGAAVLQRKKRWNLLQQAHLEAEKAENVDNRSLLRAAQQQFQGEFGSFSASTEPSVFSFEGWPGDDRLPACA
jgi:hypothetical protein